jgi:antitoxin (DNA-binding transcriptional repressor) of toxin-antitoxin stability system
LTEFIYRTGHLTLLPTQNGQSRVQLMDEVAKTGEPITITKHGQPVCQLVPYRRKAQTLYGALQGWIRITGDLIAPLDVAWEALL